MEDYKQLTQEERYQIHALLKAGHNQKKIADVLDRHTATICREIKRNRGQRGYRPQQAHQFTLDRRQAKKRITISPDLWLMVEKYLRKDWSPEQVSLWLKKEKSIGISHERIYQHIWADKSKGGSLYQHLRCKKIRRKRYGTYSRRGLIPNKMSIEDRPAIVEQKTRIGDWEIDTIIGKGHSGVLLSLTERKSRLALIAKLPDKTAEHTYKATKKLLTPLNRYVHTITSDNGKEFTKHEAIAKSLDAKFYFAHPYASWERGLNENTNGLIRQYFPKHTSLADVTNEEIQYVMEKLNHRPRKCLGMQTPHEVFFG